MATEFKRMQQRAGTNTEWGASSTVVLLVGELGAETDTGRLKVGDGVTQYGALPYVGADQGVTFANANEVLVGLVNNKSVAPDTLAENYPRRAVGAVDSVINNNWTFNNRAIFNGITTVTVAPRSGTPGANDVPNRAYVDNLFAGQVSGGPGDVNKAPILNSNGQLDSSYISSEALPKARGLFSPVIGIPTLQNIPGGGISPAANNGDYFIASDSGFYNFDTGTPGAGTTVTQGAQIIFFDSTDTWSVVEPPGTSFDPGAVRKTPTNNSEVTILPATDAVSNLTLRNRVGQTVDQLRFLDSGGAQLGGITATGRLKATSGIFLFGASTSSVGVDYPTGLSHTYVTSVSGWPADGVLTTLKNSDSDVHQTLSNSTEMYVRRFTGTWSAWNKFATTKFATQLVNPVVIVDSFAPVLSSAGLITIAFTNVNTDVNNVYSAGIFTVPVAGIYDLKTFVFLAQTTGTTLPYAIEIYVNGVSRRRIAEREVGSSTNLGRLYGSCLLNLTAGDQVTVTGVNFTSSPTTWGENQSPTITNWATFQRVGSVGTI